MPIVAFNVTVRKPSSSVQRGFGGCNSGETMLNAHFVSTVLNDVYGIQVRASHALGFRSTAQWLLARNTAHDACTALVYNAEGSVWQYIEYTS